MYKEDSLSKPERMSLKEYIGSKSMQSYTMFILLIVLAVALTVITKGMFVLPRNISMLVRQMSITGTLCLGMVLIIVHGNIDLSIGSVMLFCSTVAAELHIYGGLGLVPTILLTLLLGLLIGVWNAFWVTIMNVPAFIATMASQLIFKGLSLAISNGAMLGPFSQSYQMIGQSYIPKTIGMALAIIGVIVTVVLGVRGIRSKKRFGLRLEPAAVSLSKLALMAALILGGVFVLNLYEGIATPVLILLVLAIVFSYITTKTKFGRNLYAIGSNADAARYSGINNQREAFKAYCIMGVMAAAGAVVMTSRLNMATSTIGNMVEMDVISACVIGGVSMTGGVGSVPSALAGALLIAMLDNGMSLLNFDSFWQYVVKGVVLTVVVCYDISSRRKNK